MAQAIPVDYDPFASTGTPVDYDPFAAQEQNAKAPTESFLTRAGRRFNELNINIGGPDMGLPRHEMTTEEMERANANSSSDPGRTAGLTGRVAVQAIPSAIAGLPALALDAYDSTVNIVRAAMNQVLPEEYKRQYTPAFRYSNAVAELGERGADAVGLLRPQTEGEAKAVNLGTAVTSALGGAGAARLLARGVPAAGRTATVLEELASGPKMQAAGAAGGFAATDLVSKADLSPEGPFGQFGPLVAVGAGTIGGMAPGAGLSAVSRTGGTLAQTVKPFTQAGREVIAGQTLNRLATRPGMAVNELESAQEIVPGSRPTMAEASGDPGLIAAQTAIRNTLDTGVAPGGGNRIGARASEQNTARQEYLGRIARDENRLQALREKQNNTFDEEARPAFDNKSPVGVDVAPVFKRIDDIGKSYEGKRKEVQGAVKFARERLSQEGMDDTDPEQLYAIRKDLQQARDGKYAGSEDLKLAKKELGSIIATLDRVIEIGAPGYSRYMKLYAARAKRADRMETLQSIRTAGERGVSDPTTGLKVLKFSSMDGAVRRALADGAGDDLSPDQIRVLHNVVDDLDRAAAPSSNVAKVAGSDTMRNLSVGSVIGRFLGNNLGENSMEVGKKMLFPLKFLYSMPDEQIGKLLVDAALDPKLAAQFMRKASEHEIASLAEELAKRAASQTTGNILYGSP